MLKCASADGAMDMIRILRARQDSVDAVLLDAVLPGSDDDRVARCAIHAALMTDPLCVFVTEQADLDASKFDACAAKIQKPLTLVQVSVVLEFALLGRKPGFIDSRATE